MSSPAFRSRSRRQRFPKHFPAAGAETATSSSSSRRDAAARDMGEMRNAEGDGWLIIGGFAAENIRIENTKVYKFGHF